MPAAIDPSAHAAAALPLRASVARWRQRDAARFALVASARTRPAARVRQRSQA